MLLKDSITQNTYNKVAQKYWEKVRTTFQYNASYDIFLQELPLNASVLELGCGPGNMTGYFLNKRKDLKITATDLSPNMLKLASKNNPNAEYLEMDCRKISALNNTFNAISAAFIMPYLNLEASAKLILDCTSLLNSEGLLYISTMEGDYSQSGYEKTTFSSEDQVFIHYHQKDTITQNLKKNGLKLLQFIKQTSEEPNGHIYTDMIFIAKKTRI